MITEEYNISLSSLEKYFLPLLEEIGINRRKALKSVEDAEEYKQSLIDMANFLEAREKGNRATHLIAKLENIPSTIKGVRVMKVCQRKLNKIISDLGLLRVMEFEQKGFGGSEVEW